MKTVLTVFTTVVLSILAGCSGTAGGRKYLTVDFQDAHTLRYRFVSIREIALDWKPEKSVSKPHRKGIDRSYESMDMVMAYTPIEIDPCGLTTIRATCESVKIKRTKHKGRRKDAAESFAGKTFTFTIAANGRIEDYSQLDELIREVGKKVFRKDSKTGRTKEPDMIDDFIATQWFLWDSVSSIEKPVEGVLVGQVWKSKLSVPNMMVLREARDVTYTLDEIRQSEKGQLAVIRSSYLPAESVPQNWPVPYSGRLQMSGTYGFPITFVKGFKVVDLQGEGEELFNIDAGRTEQYNQKYEMRLEGSQPSPFAGLSPRITVKQKLSMKLLAQGQKSKRAPRRK